MAYDNTKYAYAIGRIRVLETRLLSQAGIDRMLGAKDAKEAFKILHDLDYASHSTDIDDVKDFEQVLNIGLREVKELLDGMAPYPEVMAVLWLRYDIHNIKTLLRAKYQELSEEAIESNVIPLGSISHNLIQKYIFEGEYKDKIPQELQDIIDQATALCEEHDDMKLTDNFLDHQYFAHVQKIIKRSKNSFLKTFLALHIDAWNIHTALRIKHLELEAPEDIFQLEGSIPKTVFEQYLAQDDAKQADSFLLENISSTPYYEAVRKGLEHLSDEYSFSQLEIELENMLIKHMQEAKRITFGPEPLIAYFWAKKNNAHIIRSILIGKLNGIETPQIKQSLYNLYI